MSLKKIISLGNSIALPPWKWVLKRLCALYERDATMGSLFDGIGGFPLVWERLNGPGTCLWASEIEEFPIAVTERRIGNEAEITTEMTMDEAALEAAQAWSITQEQMEIVVEAFGRFAKAVEAAIGAQIEAIIKAAAFIQALKSGNFSWTQEDADKAVKDFWEGVRRAGELVNMHQEEVLERKEQRKRFEQENRAKIRQYQTFCMGRQRLRRTEKRYRKWRGPAR